MRWWKNLMMCSRIKRSAEKKTPHNDYNLVCSMFVLCSLICLSSDLSEGCPFVRVFLLLMVMESLKFAEFYTFYKHSLIQCMKHNHPTDWNFDLLQFWHSAKMKHFDIQEILEYWKIVLNHSSNQSKPSEKILRILTVLLILDVSGNQISLDEI